MCMITSRCLRVVTVQRLDRFLSVPLTDIILVITYSKAWL